MELHSVKLIALYFPLSLFQSNKIFETCSIGKCEFLGIYEIQYLPEKNLWLKFAERNEGNHEKAPLTVVRKNKSMGIQLHQRWNISFLFRNKRFTIEICDRRKNQVAMNGQIQIKKSTPKIRNPLYLTTIIIKSEIYQYKIRKWLDRNDYLLIILKSLVFKQTLF